MATLADVLTDLGVALDDWQERVTTETGSVASLIDRRWALGRDNDQQGKEIVWLVPPASWPNPVDVIASIATSGTLTFSPALPSGTVPAGTPYLIGGRQWAYARLRAALEQVLREGAVKMPVLDTGEIIAGNQYEYPIPEAWIECNAVEYSRPGSGYWRPIKPNPGGRGIGWRIVPGSGLLTLHGGYSGAVLRLHGRTAATIPVALTDTIPAALNLDWLVDAAKARLLLDSAGAGDRQAALVVYQQALRRAPGRSIPANTVVL